MTPHWTQQLARALHDGRTTALPASRLDALLLWLSNPENPHAADLDTAIRHVGLSRLQASERAYDLLDQLLFEHAGPPSLRTLGLTTEADPRLTKQRYRRLIQVYHPDRHSDHNDWASRRTERINLAFRACQGQTGTASDRTSTSASDARPSGYRAVLETLWSMAASRLRHAWDLTASFPRWRLAGLGALGLLLIGLFLSFDEPPPARPVAMPVPSNSIQAAPSNQRPNSAARPTERREIDEAAVSEAKPPAPAPTESVPAIRTAESRPPAEVHDTEPSAPAPDDQERGRDIAASAPAPAPDPAVSPPPAPAVVPALPDRSHPPVPEQTAPREPRLAIPPAPSPSQPISPTPPSPPALAQRMPLTTPSAPGGLSAAIDCRSVPELLGRFQQAYDAGDLERLMTLYSPAARENNFDTWSGIRQTYAAWFSQTAARQIRFEQLRVQPTANGERCAATAFFQVAYLDAQGGLTNQNGVIEFLFEPRGAELLLLRVRY